MIIVFVLILVGLIIGGYYWYRYKNEREEEIQIPLQQPQQQLVKFPDGQVAKIETQVLQSLKSTKPQSSNAPQGMYVQSLSTPSGKASTNTTPTNLTTDTPLPKSRLGSNTARSKIKSKIRSAKVSTGVQSGTASPPRPPPPPPPPSAMV